MKLEVRMDRKVAAADFAVADAGRHPIVPLGRARQVVSLIGPYASHGLHRIGHVGVVGLALLVFSAVMFISAVNPLRQQIQADMLTIEQSASAAVQPAAVAAPAAAASWMGSFLGDLPGADDLPTVLGRIAEIADETGVSLERGDYSLVAGGNGSVVDQYRVDFPLTGSYLQIRNFVDGSLIAVPSMALEGFRIERETIAAASVDAELEFSIFVRAQ